MPVLTEDNLEFTFNNGVQSAIHFDDAQHGMSHCMKAVDFIIECKNCYWFIEVKDPDNPKATEQAKKDFAVNLKAKELNKSLVGKYRDTFLYRWAMNKLDKPVKYIVLLCMAALDNDLALLMSQNDTLRNNLPVDKSGVWTKQIVDACVIVTLEKWNKQFSRWPVKRMI